MRAGKAFLCGCDVDHLGSEFETCPGCRAKEAARLELARIEAEAKTKAPKKKK